MIVAGLVRVNGKPAVLGQKIDPRHDSVQIGGRRIAQEHEAVYLMLYKPRGYVTTMQDELERKCVAELVAEVGKRIYPVGRLDRDSEGLLLMTNDGAFANAVAHPAHHIAKTYRVSVKPAATEEQLNALSASILIDGRETAPAEVHVLQQAADRSLLEIVLHEGRNRQIRRLCEEAGLTVARLKRVSVGQLELGKLRPGEYRRLTKDEVSLLKRQSGRF